MEYAHSNPSQGSEDMKNKTHLFAYNFSQLELMPQ